MSAFCVIEVSAPVESLETIAGLLLSAEESFNAILPIDAPPMVSMKTVAMTPERREELHRLRKAMSILDRIEVMGFASLPEEDRQTEGPLLEQIERLTKDIQAGRSEGISQQRIASLRTACSRRIETLEALKDVLVGRYAATMHVRVPEDKEEELRASLAERVEHAVVKRLSVGTDDERSSWLARLLGRNK